MSAAIAEFRRWMTLRCALCGHRFRRRGDSRYSFGNRDRTVYHEHCMESIVWRRKADERLRVLSVAVELAQVSGRDVTLVMELRAPDEDARIDASNVAWRVFYDMEKAAVS